MVRRFGTLLKMYEGIHKDITGRVMDTIILSHGNSVSRICVCVGG